MYGNYRKLAYVKQRLCTTAQAAEAVGITRATLQEWIRAGKIDAPITQLQGGRAVRLWSAREIRNVLKYKQENYRKGRGRKSKHKR
jgi:excisionase family DNA binding protein